jgi:hypothetical protein
MSEVDRPVGSPEEFDLVPSPRVLPMLGEINLEQWRCIGELVDNSVDGFLHAHRRGELIEDPVVQITLPEADREDAIVQILDNGPGMTPQNLARAVKAGWSGNNPVDNLGLFGMGFNIATARLGSTTEVWTTQSGEAAWHGLEIDFDRLQRQQNFRTAHLKQPKPDKLVQGTRIIIRRLKPAQRQWLARSANQSQVRRRLAQAYAAMLRPAGKPVEFKLYLNNKTVQPRPFCVWSEERSTQLPDLGEVSAIQQINYTLADRFHCIACMNWLPTLETPPATCPVCDGAGTVQRRMRRVHGWIGLQRYADTQEFGFDFIRNGRKIELASKDLFFWRGENGDEPEYPIDDPSRRGRFVGEIHIDHCRVNFAKERFDRSDPAWDEMVRLVRGEGPLRPEKARELGHGPNNSPLFKLYRAFRRMRPHSSVAGGWKRLIAVPENRIAQELAQKFYDGHPDYHDDLRWWRLIEEAERRLLLEDEKVSDGDGGGDAGLPPDLGGAEEDGEPKGVGEPSIPKEPEVNHREQRREAPSLSRTYVYSPAGQSFLVRAFETVPQDPDLPDGSAWTLRLADVGSRTYHFLFRPHADVFRSITLEPLDALLTELAILTHDYTRASKEPPTFAKILAGFREQYAQIASLDARLIALDANDVLTTLVSSLIQNCPPVDRQKFFDSLTVEQQADVMRSLASKRIAPTGAIADGSFLRYSPRYILGRIVEAFPELCFDSGFWDTPYAALDYGDAQLTARARQQVIYRACSLISDATWLSEADANALGAMRKEELVRGLMSVALLRPDREIV